MTVRRYGGTEMLVAVVHARNSFRMRSYEKQPRKSFRMRSYKIIGLKVPPTKCKEPVFMRVSARRRGAFVSLFASFLHCIGFLVRCSEHPGPHGNYLRGCLDAPHRRVQVARAHDMVTIKDSPRLVAANPHCNLLGDVGGNQIPNSTSAQIVNEQPVKFLIARCQKSRAHSGVPVVPEV